MSWPHIFLCAILFRAQNQTMPRSDGRPQKLWSLCSSHRGDTGLFVLLKPAGRWLWFAQDTDPEKDDQSELWRDILLFFRWTDRFFNRWNQSHRLAWVAGRLGQCVPRRNSHTGASIGFNAEAKFMVNGKHLKLLYPSPSFINLFEKCRISLRFVFHSGNFNM